MFFTSQTALRAVQQRCAVLELPLPTVFDGVKIAAVGPATAEAVNRRRVARQFYFQNSQWRGSRGRTRIRSAGEANISAAQ